MDLEIKISATTLRSASRLLKQLDLRGRELLGKEQQNDLDKTLYELRRLLWESERE